MDIQRAGGNSPSDQSQIVNLERILNLPKDIFTAEQNLAKKLILMTNIDKLQNQAMESNSQLLDLYA